MRPFKADGNFRAVETQDGLRRTAVRGAGAMIFAQGASFVIQMAATVILARLLTPADFGVVSMVTTFSLLLSSWGLNGFVEAILQREEITEGLASNLFWINIGCGTLLTAVFVIVSPWIAAFFHNPLVAHVAIGMSLTIFVGSFGIIHTALLQRAMLFRAVSVNTIISRGVSVGVSIALAMAGWKYWSLVAGNVAQSVSVTIGAWFLCRWMPRTPRRVEGTGGMIRFALNVYSHFSFNYFAGNTDNLLVGWRYGAGALGFYKKAFDLFTLPVSQLVSPMGAVVVSTLSRFQGNREQYERYFLSGMSVLALVGMGIGADFTLVGKDLIRFLLGPSWDETGRIFTFFGPGIGVMLLYNTHGWIHLSTGRPDRWFRWGVIEFLCTTGLFLIALPHGPAGIALAWTVSFFVLLVPAFWYAGTPSGFRVRGVLETVWRYFAASVIAALGGKWFLSAVPLLAGVPGAFGALARTLVDSLIFFALYLGAVVALYQGTRPIREVLTLIGDLLPRTRNKGVVVSAPPVPETSEV